jgi:uncharacterized protein (DUF427 family)
MRVTRSNLVLAESDKTVVVEGNHYFPPDSINWEYFQKSDTHTSCPWKGEASYYNIVINEAVEPDAAWYYPEPKEAANQIKNHVAFYRGVEAGP